MATTKRAQYQFRVKEGPGITHEVLEGVIELVMAMFITAELCDRTPVSERPLRERLSVLRASAGISFDEAQQVANFLNQHLVSVGITRFGDAEDAARDIRLLERSDDSQRLSIVISELNDTLAAGDIRGAVKSIKSVEYLAGELVRQWRKALDLSREVLRKFGQKRDSDAYA